MTGAELDAFRCRLVGITDPDLVAAALREDAARRAAREARERGAK